MSYSVCLIGNSHLAAIAQAWRKDRAGAREDVSLVFFGSAAGSVRHLELRDGTLAPRDEEALESFRRSSGGKSAVAIAEYDAFVLYGLGFNISRLLSVLADYGTAEDLKWGPVKHIVSDDCLEMMIRHTVAQSAGLMALEQIRTVSQAPVILCPMPFRSETWFHESGLAADPRLSNREFLDRLTRRFMAVSIELCAARGGELVWQDRSTWAMPGFTKAQFSVGGHSWKRTAAAEDEPDAASGSPGVPGSKGRRRSGLADNKHMNDSYGAIMLKQILAGLDALSRGRVLEPTSDLAKLAGVLLGAK